MYALVTLNLDKADGTKRAKFDTEMANRQWKKLQNRSTTWYANFKPEVDYNGVLGTTKSDVKAAAAAASIASTPAVVQVGPQAPIEF